MVSINKVILVGNVGASPEVRSMQSGKEVCKLSLATSESWLDKHTNQRKTKTEWHRVVIFNQGLVNVAKEYVLKGSKVYIEGELNTRSWEDNTGQKKYTTEVVLNGFSSKLILLDKQSQDNISTDNIDNLEEVYDDDDVPF